MATYYDQVAAEIVEVVAGSGGSVKILSEPYPDFLRASRAANAELNRLQRVVNRRHARMLRTYNRLHNDTLGERLVRLIANTSVYVRTVDTLVTVN